MSSLKERMLKGKPEPMKKVAKPAMRRKPRKPGLWLPTVKVEVETVRKAHTSLCSCCGQLPEGRRLKVGIGTGRHGTTEIFCNACGRAWLQDREDEALRAQNYLLGDTDESIRLPPDEQRLEPMTTGGFKKK